MSIQDWFSFKSKAQHQQELNEFEQRIFPLGPQQRARALALLEEITGLQRQEQELLFAFVSAKDRYLKSGRDEAALERARRELLAGRWVPKRHAPLVLALVVLDAEVQDLALYPSGEVVRLRAQALAGEEA